MNNEDRDILLSRIGEDVSSIRVNLARIEEAVKSAHKRLDALDGVRQRLAVIERSTASSARDRVAVEGRRGVVIAAVLGLAGSVIAALLGYLAG